MWPSNDHSLRTGKSTYVSWVNQRTKWGHLQWLHVSLPEGIVFFNGSLMVDLTIYRMSFTYPRLNFTYGVRTRHSVGIEFVPNVSHYKMMVLNLLRVTENVNMILLQNEDCFLSSGYLKGKFDHYKMTPWLPGRGFKRSKESACSRRFWRLMPHAASVWGERLHRF